MVGEVWSPAEKVAPYLKGIPALFNFDLGVAIIKAVNSEKDSTGLISTYKTIADYYLGVTSEYMDATFLTNHDQNRILSELKNDQNKLKIASSILMTLPGTPYIYYGEEIGMLGKKPDEHIREPFLWNDKGVDPGQTTWIQPKYSTDNAVIPLSKQINDSNSIFNHYKCLIQIRNSSFALSYGALKYSAIKKNKLVSFIRSHQDESLLVIHNLSGKYINTKLPDSLKAYSSVYFKSNAEATFDSGKFMIPPYSTLILN